MGKEKIDFIGRFEQTGTCRKPGMNGSDDCWAVADGEFKGM
jgi:hypothetical protein